MLSAVHTCPPVPILILVLVELLLIATLLVCITAETSLLECCALADDCAAASVKCKHKDVVQVLIGQALAGVATVLTLKTQLSATLHRPLNCKHRTHPLQHVWLSCS
jgi:hypothetical protein